jgi:signal transduction histidine kinase
VRRRIVLLVVGMTTLVVLAFAIPLAVLIRHNVYRDAVTALQREAGNVAIYLRSDSTSPTAAQIKAYVDKLDPERSVSVQLPTGAVVGSTPPGGTEALPSAPTPTVTRQPTPGGDGGFPGAGVRRGPPQTDTVTVGDGQLAQLQVFSPQGFYVVRVYASNDQLHSGETGWWFLLSGAALLLIALGVVAGEVLTRRIVRPLVETAATAQRLGSGDTTARAPTNGPPEVADVGRALNRLADRIDQLIAEERETVADMSHRLRTPLTALRLDAEALRDPVDAERVGQHASTLERMLTALIHAARRPQREGRMPSCDARPVTDDRVAFWSVLAEDQGRRGTVELPDSPVSVRAGAEDLAAALDALLENVIAHTPEGTDFAVRLEPTASGARLSVSDDGPGLPDDAHVRGRSDRGSSGLGLDIARRCAEASGGSMTLAASPSGGALVTLQLGAP